MTHRQLQLRQISSPTYGRRDQRSYGFTLIEASIAMLIMAIILLGSIDLFISSLRGSVDSLALNYANEDASNALQTIVEKTREAYYFQLPDESDFTPPAGSSAGSYQTSMAVDGTSETICTGMLVTMPNKTQTVSVNLAEGNTVQYSGLYYRDQGTNGLVSGQQILYYRADLPSGPPPYTVPAEPDAANGNCLWELTVSDNDGSPTVDGPIITSIAPVINAVQFLRPQTLPNALGVTTSIPYEVEIKVICSSYAPIGTDRYETNEVTNGAAGTTSLDGKCVFMRDHELAATYESGSTNPVNNKFNPAP